jgi:hypothetical protein
MKAKLLNDLKYSLDQNDHLAALEIGERLMRQGGHSELGISGPNKVFWPISTCDP